MSNAHCFRLCLLCDVFCLVVVCLVCDDVLCVVCVPWVVFLFCGVQVCVICGLFMSVLYLVYFISGEVLMLLYGKVRFRAVFSV